MDAFLKIFFMLISVVLIAAPIFITWVINSAEVKNRRATRLRFIVFTAIYAIAAAIIIMVANNAVQWFTSLSLIKWILRHISVSSMTDYAVKVYTAIILNILIGIGYLLTQNLVRIGYKKLNITKKDAVLTTALKIERKVMDEFNDASWIFIGKIMNVLTSILSALYALMFIVYQIPAAFSASWIPYKEILALFEAGYVYPTITLLVMWEVTFFLESIEVLSVPYSEIKKDETVEIEKVETSIPEIDEECQKTFSDYYAKSPEIVPNTEQNYSEHSHFTNIITDAIRNDIRNGKEPKESFANCLDILSEINDENIETNKNLVFKGNFFSEFSMYLFRYLSVILARGENIIFVCNNDKQIDSVHDYIKCGLKEISSIQKNSSCDVKLDKSIWKTVRTTEKNSLNEINSASILITDMVFLCSNEFEQTNKEFINLLDTVVFVDTVKTVNTYPQHIAIFNTRIEHISKTNAEKVKDINLNKDFKIRYTKRPVRYLFFDDTEIPGLKNILSNMLSVSIEEADAMHNMYSPSVRCYRYDPSLDKGKNSVIAHHIKSDEELGVIMNMAVCCLEKGASNVTIFTDESIPYKNFFGSIKSNLKDTSININEENLRINKYFYNPDDYSVIIAIDTGNNIPAAMRKYISMTTDKPSLLIVFSFPYLFRDYYFDNINTVWESHQMARIPVAEGTNRDIAYKILVRANEGGITEDNILALAKKMKGFEEETASENITEILKKMLRTVFKIECDDPATFYSYFNFVCSRKIGENGKYISETKVVLQRKNLLYEIIKLSDKAILAVGEERYFLDIPKKRITQNYIEGQNLIYGGEIYVITKIDTKNGVISASLSTSGKNNEPYKYIQKRIYTLECANDKIEYLHTPKHLIISQAKGEKISLESIDISAFKTPAEVFTKGYYTVDTHSMNTFVDSNEYETIDAAGHDIRAKQTYRKYGRGLANPTYRFDEIANVNNSFSLGRIEVISVKMSGKFGDEPKKLLNLLCVMLNEILHAMFPAVADSVVVCPAYNDDVENDETEALHSVLAKQPKLRFSANEHYGDGDIEFLIIEDCADELGVVSTLMSSGGDTLKTLFAPIFQYLDWYRNKADNSSEYLYFGMDKEPDFFDFSALYELADILGNNKYTQEVREAKNIVKYKTCDFCGKRYRVGGGISKTEHGRFICSACAKELVGNNKASLKSHLDKAKIFLENYYGIKTDDSYEFCFESTSNIISTLNRHPEFVTRNTDITAKSYMNNKTFYLESSLPSANLSELLVRELTYAWQLKNLPDLDEKTSKGHIALVSVQYLRYLKKTSIADTRANYYEASESIAAEGYRELATYLLDNPKYRSNPFIYLLERYSDNPYAVTVNTKHRISPDRKYGMSYKTNGSDRSKNGDLTYFYYSQLSSARKEFYLTVLRAVENLEESIDVTGLSQDDVEKTLQCVRRDHPELFWFTGDFNVGDDGNILPCYGATAREIERIQSDIEDAEQEYLSDITSDMSAYDVVLSIHSKILNNVEYDKEGLKKQKEEGGPKRGEIDYLRTICGVFLNRKAVCAGYADAVQYLLQKCGIESAKCSGIAKTENGNKEPHAWNIVKVDGDYYYVDATWDDSLSTIQNIQSGDIGLTYFCVTTDEILRTRDLSLCPVDNMPVCSATKCNYYYYNNLVLDAYDLTAIQKFASSAAADGQDFFTFKCKTKAVFDECEEKLFATDGDMKTIIPAFAKDSEQVTGYYHLNNPDIWTITVIIADN